jgi:hypothetical protein
LERPFDINVNYAIGKPDTFVPLLEMSDDTLSTINPKAKNTTTPPLKETMVPTLSLQQLCERYFLSAPIFMNVVVGGVLETNNWANAQCVPKLIFVEVGNSAEGALPSTVLTNHNYTKVRTLNKREVYLHSSARGELEQKYQQAEAAAKALTVITLKSVTDVVGKHFGVEADVGRHYEPHSAKVVYRFARVGEPIEL